MAANCITGAWSKFKFEYKAMKRVARQLMYDKKFFVELNYHRYNQIFLYSEFREHCSWRKTLNPASKYSLSKQAECG